MLALANKENLQRFDLVDDLPRGELTNDGREFLTELGLISRKSKECPDEFHFMFNEGSDLF